MTLYASSPSASSSFSADDTPLATAAEYAQSSGVMRGSSCCVDRTSPELGASSSQPSARTASASARMAAQASAPRRLSTTDTAVGDAESVAAMRPAWEATAASRAEGGTAAADKPCSVRSGRAARRDKTRAVVARRIPTAAAAAAAAAVQFQESSGLC